MTWTTMTTPIGELLLAADDEGLTHLLMEPFDPPAGPRDDDDPVLAKARAQLDAYFAGDLTEFDLPLHPAGTEFQRRVWDALTTIPYGRTASYGQIAAAIGAPGAARAVGLANGRNPISIIVPCHRVIGSGGALTGYGGGLDRKRYLLGLETGARALL
jgi:methylated-DNA-[protein]-cysteine S-methyltransferase